MLGCLEPLDDPCEQTELDGSTFVRSLVRVVHLEFNGVV